MCLSLIFASLFKYVWMKFYDVKINYSYNEELLQRYGNNNKSLDATPWFLRFYKLFDWHVLILIGT